MNIPFFTPKAAASTLVGVGSMGGGGGAVYLYQMPKNWKDLLIKEGYVFLSSEEDYKGMFNDQKETDGWTQENDLKQAKDTDVKDKADGYCKKKFAEALPSSSDANYSKTKQNLIAFCTTEGIKTVKGRLIQSQKKDWIADSNADDKWKAVFAVYRYNDKFINWLKSDDPTQNANLSSTSNVSEYTKLQSACKKLLAKPWKEINDDKLFNYGSWWCVELGYTTIKEKIQKAETSWTAKGQDDSDWPTVKSKWENNAEVKKWAAKANGNEDENSELTEDSLKKLCEDKNVNSQLSDNDSYQEKYRVIKAVCQSTATSE